MKPMLATDYDPSKLIFPLIAQPKVDGVRALNMTGKLTGRSLKTFGNRYVTSRYSHSALIGLDGEMAAEHECHPDLCRLTTSALASHNGEPYILWWLFDYVTPETRHMAYEDRLSKLHIRVDQIRNEVPDLWKHLRIMPSVRVTNHSELESQDLQWVEQGYEGTIIRRPGLTHKQGRSTVREGGLLRIKQFVDFEFLIEGFEEGQHNANEATINELGHTERSTHQANMIPNGMIGALLGSVVKDIEVGGVQFKAGDPIKVAAGRLTHEERKVYFENFGAIKGKIGKAKVFPKGMKEKLRFPTFQTFRDSADMS